MKKILTISVGLLISALLGIGISTAASGIVNYDDTNFVDRVMEAAGVDKTYKNDAKELEKLADDELAFQNLYLFMYQNIRNGPQEAALKVLSSRTSYRKSELEEILFDGDISAIINHSSKLQDAEEPDSTDLDSLMGSYSFSSEVQEFLTDYYEDYVVGAGDTGLSTQDADFATQVLTQEAVLEEYSYLESLYKNELEFQMENRVLAYEALASEIFLNGDTGDSAGIDLLYDLDLVNYVIFGETITGDDIDESDLEAEEDDGEVVLTSLLETTLGKEAWEDVRVDDVRVDDVNVEDVSVEDVIVLASEEDSDEIDPDICYEDSDLAAALDDFYDAGGEDAEAPEESVDDTETDNASDVSDDEDDEGGSESEDTKVSGSDDLEYEEKLEDFTDMLDSLSGPAGDWSRLLPCGEIFCITVDFVTETDDAEYDAERYEKKDNCIACHIAYISERFEDTMSKTLIPGKVSMNYFEDATCKEAGNKIDLDFNFFVYLKAVVTGLGDDTDEMAGKETDEFLEEYASVLGLPENAEDLDGQTKEEEACVAGLNVAEMSGVDVSLDTATSDCHQADLAQDEAVAEIRNSFLFDAQVTSMDSLYTQVGDELLRLYLYFDSFNTALADSVGSVTDIVNKEYCP